VIRAAFDAATPGPARQTEAVTGGRVDSAAPLDQQAPEADDLVLEVRGEASPRVGDLAAEELAAAPRVVFGAWLRRATPAPTPWRRGTLTLGPGRFEWQPRRAGAQPGPRTVALEGVDVTRVRTTTVREVLRVDRSCTVFGLATDVELLELAVLPADLPSTRAALRSARSQP